MGTRRVWALAATAAAVTAGAALWRPAESRLTDLSVYLGAVSGLADGTALYDFTRGAAPFTYPPFAAVLFTPLTWLPVPVVQVAWTLATVAVVAGVAFLTTKTGTRREHNVVAHPIDTAVEPPGNVVAHPIDTAVEPPGNVVAHPIDTAVERPGNVVAYPIDTAIERPGNVVAYPIDTAVERPGLASARCPAELPASGPARNRVRPRPADRPELSTIRACPQGTRPRSPNSVTMPSGGGPPGVGGPWTRARSTINSAGERIGATLSAASLSTAGVALLLTLSAPVSSNFKYGQVSLFLAALVLADMTALRRTPWHGTLIGLAAAVKLTPLIFIPLLWVTGRRKAAALATATFAGCGLAGFVALPRDSWRFWTGEGFDVSRLGYVTGLGNQSLNGALMRLGAAPGVRETLVLIVGGVIVLLALRRAARLKDNPLAATVVVGAASIVLSPVSWTHHQVWLVLAAFLPVRPVARIVILAVMILPLVGETRLLLAVVVAAMLPIQAGEGRWDGIRTPATAAGGRSAVTVA
ncbi:DUF2029 domain-containing protein [Actinoplanes bogorensis]|uniref:DUF2029 domain-containing protein n=1 Tax=Paractinoplanes bogorensis TaxID=1610840 RepID=A0ABS5Z150_9ACTN|nr:glycosyltransferase 87 family protein [Actinoplanes bogorensis]MBU2669419.1 DUF2029 domain-containing protein [Actinoplanes bogorensis]